jgi:hypothetical protein
MMVSSSAHGLRALPDWSAVPSNSEDDRLFMNLRLAFYGQVICALNLVFYLWNMLLATRGGMSVAAYLSNAETLLHLSVTTLFGVLWLVCRGGNRSARALNVLDVVSLPGVMCVYATMTLRSAQERDQTLVLMMITIMNVIIHAVVIPGTARRTFWLFGCVSRAVICTSRSKRSVAVAVPAPSPRSLIAHGRRSILWLAR